MDLLVGCVVVDIVPRERRLRLDAEVTLTRRVHRRPSVGIVPILDPHICARVLHTDERNTFRESRT